MGSPSRFFQVEAETHSLWLSVLLSELGVRRQEQVLNPDTLVCGMGFLGFVATKLPDYLYIMIL